MNYKKILAIVIEIVVFIVGAGFIGMATKMAQLAGYPLLGLLIMAGLGFGLIILMKFIWRKIML
ncbi:MAG: hypothetical protein DRQ51_09850 [Gammaproteobacteria bacterium]|nr:MAG: hypothetical protein DRQ51_09850 [Gammaproteobacteria bacterium]